MSAKPNMSASTESAARGDHPLRPISFGTPAVNVERRDDGTIYLRPKAQLLDYPVRLTDRLHHWAKAAPNRVFMAERNAARGWRQITYAELLACRAHRICAAGARLSAEKPVVILSGNSIDHALIAFGALYAGIPFCPVSPAYSLVARLRQARLSDEAADARPRVRRRCREIRRCAGRQRVLAPRSPSRGAVPGRDVTTLQDLMAAPLHPPPTPCTRRSARTRSQIPADLGFDRQPEGGHQHPAHDLRQPGDAARDAGVPEGRAACHRRLAAVESHLAAITISG